MTQLPESIDKVAELRRAFDESFASMPPERVAVWEDLLDIRIGGDAYAIRVRDISGFVASGKIVPVPSRVPELLGMAGVKGSLVPVFSLAALLGYGRPDEAPRWLALAGKTETVAFGFGEFEEYLRVLASEVFLPEKSDPGRNFIESGIRAGGAARSIINIGSMTDAIKARAGHVGRERE
jgi:purine-binding chemotaxis protein CheW